MTFKLWFESHCCLYQRQLKHKKKHKTQNVLIAHWSLNFQTQIYPPKNLTTWILKQMALFPQWVMAKLRRLTTKKRRGWSNAATQNYILNIFGAFQSASITHCPSFSDCITQQPNPTLSSTSDKRAFVNLSLPLVLSDKYITTHSYVCGHPGPQTASDCSIDLTWKIPWCAHFIYGG